MKDKTLLRRFFFSVILIVALLTQSTSVLAVPTSLAIYQNDPRSKPNKVKCGLCHINPAGGGPRNAFGQAFHAAGKKITDDLVAKFPQNFKGNIGTPINNIEFAIEAPSFEIPIDAEDLEVTLADLTTRLTVTLTQMPDGLNNGENLKFMYVFGKTNKKNKRALKLLDVETQEDEISFDVNGTPAEVGIEFAMKDKLIDKVIRLIAKDKKIKSINAVIFAVDANDKPIKEGRTQFAVEFNLIDSSETSKLEVDLLDEFN